MKIEHIAIWTGDLEKLKFYYEKFFGARSNEKYVNPLTLFESYFLEFESGTRLELMYKPTIPVNLNDTVIQYRGIIHFAFSVNSKAAVEEKAKELELNGYRILRGPRVTGDGYYEFETMDPDGNRLEVMFSNTGAEI